MTGIAAELLGVQTKKRAGTFFADLIPLTEGEIQVLMYANKPKV